MALGTSTRFSKGMIKSRTEASRMVRGGKRSSVRGALTRAPLSPRCTALSVASCGNHGAAPNSGTRVPGNLGGNGCFAKQSGLFPPTWRVLECGKRVWKTQNNRPSVSATSEAFGCRCPVFPVLAPACAAVRIGLLLSTLSRLTHIL